MRSFGLFRPTASMSVTTSPTGGVARSNWKSPRTGNSKDIRRQKNCGKAFHSFPPQKCRVREGGSVPVTGTEKLTWQHSMLQSLIGGSFCPQRIQELRGHALRVPFRNGLLPSCRLLDRGRPARWARPPLPQKLVQQQQLLYGREGLRINKRSGRYLNGICFFLEQSNGLPGKSCTWRGSPAPEASYPPTALLHPPCWWPYRSAGLRLLPSGRQPQHSCTKSLPFERHMTRQQPPSGGSAASTAPNPNRGPLPWPSSCGQGDGWHPPAVRGTQEDPTVRHAGASLPWYRCLQISRARHVIIVDSLATVRDVHSETT